MPYSPSRGEPRGYTPSRGVVRSSPEMAVQETHPDLPWYTRWWLKNPVEYVGPEQVIKELEKRGFDVVPKSGGQYAIQKPGEKEWHVVDPRKTSLGEFIKDALDWPLGIGKEVAWLGGGAVGAAKGGPLGAVAGAGLGQAGFQGAMDLLARAGGAEPTIGESAERAGEEALIGAGSQAAFGALGAGAKAAWKGGKLGAQNIARKVRGLPTVGQQAKIAAEREAAGPLWRGIREGVEPRLGEGGMLSQLAAERARKLPSGRVPGPTVKPKPAERKPLWETGEQAEGIAGRPGAGMSVEEARAAAGKRVTPSGGRAAVPKKPKPEEPFYSPKSPRERERWAQGASGRKLSPHEQKIDDLLASNSGTGKPFGVKFFKVDGSHESRRVIDVDLIMSTAQRDYHAKTALLESLKLSALRRIAKLWGMGKDEAAKAGKGRLISHIRKAPPKNAPIKNRRTVLPEKDAARVLIDIDKGQWITIKLRNVTEVSGTGGKWSVFTPGLKETPKRLSQQPVSGVPPRPGLQIGTPARLAGKGKAGKEYAKGLRDIPAGSAAGIKPKTPLRKVAAEEATKRGWQQLGRQMHHLDRLKQSTIGGGIPGARTARRWYHTRRLLESAKDYAMTPLRVGSEIGGGTLRMVRRAAKSLVTPGPIKRKLQMLAKAGTKRAAFEPLLKKFLETDPQFRDWWERNASKEL